MTPKEISRMRHRFRYVACDYVTTAIAFLLFNISRFYILNDEFHNPVSLYSYLTTKKLIAEQIIIPFALLGIYWLSGYYNRPFDKSRLSEFLNTFFSAFINTLLIFFILLVNDRGPILLLDYMLICILFLLLLIFTYTGRLIITSATRRYIITHNISTNVLIVGNPEYIKQIQGKLSEARLPKKYNVAGFIKVNNTETDEHPYFNLENIENICNEKDIHQIILATGSGNDAMILDLLYRLFPLNIPIKIMPDTLSYLTSSIRLTDILAEPFIDLSSSPLSECAQNIKDTFDKLLSLIALIALSPLILTLTILVKRSSKGPVFYKQERIGKRGKPFIIYKFRSMLSDAEKNGPMLSSEDDMRVTPIGKVMRKYRLDELPQFWNVLKGDMSLVGPRPERDFYIKKILGKAPYYSLVFQVKPGITSWGMVKFGYASNINQMVERTKFDLIYITNMSIALDLKILIYTIRTIVKGSGV